jgi:polyphenol oxidase
MQAIQLNSLTVWQFHHLAAEQSIRHFVTDRNAIGKEFTLGNTSVWDKEYIAGNRKRLAQALEINESELFFPNQVHKTRVLHVDRKTRPDELLETDALITAEKEICIAVMSADCVPIILYDKRNRAIAAIHSGWRGTVARILEKTLEAMSEAFGTRGQDVLAGIGPSVCQESYEVGEEVVAAVNQSFGNNNDLMIPQPGNKAKLDLWKANKIQLMEFGVYETQIVISNLCTVKRNNQFFSARKGDAGRFAAGIMMLND